MRRLLIHAAALVLAACAATPSFPEPAPTREMEPLSRLIGHWSSEWDPPDAGTGAPPSRAYGEVEVRWTLDGRFLERDGWYVAGSAPRLQFHELIAWDPGQGRFRSWYFDSTGESGQGTLTAEEGGRVLRMEFTGAGHAGVGVLRFPDPDTLKWVWRAQDGTEVAGTNRRIE